MSESLSQLNLSANPTIASETTLNELQLEEPESDHGSVGSEARDRIEGIGASELDSGSESDDYGEYSANL